jgi:osmotically-inducible protein OsmY
MEGELADVGAKKIALERAASVPGVEHIVDAVRLVLEKDPLVDASQLGVSTHQAVVTLTGVVRSEVERQAAERDAWCVFGVDEVKNDIEVRG